MSLSAPLFFDWQVGCQIAAERFANHKRHGFTAKLGQAPDLVHDKGRQGEALTLSIAHAVSFVRLLELLFYLRVTAGSEKSRTCS